MARTVGWWSRAVGVAEHSSDGLHGTGGRLTEESVSRAAEAARQRHEQRTTTSTGDVMASPDAADPHVLDESRLGHALIVLQGNLLFWYENVWGANAPHWVSILKCRAGSASEHVCGLLFWQVRSGLSHAPQARCSSGKLQTFRPFV